MDIDIPALLALPASERLALAEILSNSVGYPTDIDASVVPAWRQAEIQRQLARYAGDEPPSKAKAKA